MSSETLTSNIIIERFKGSVPNPDWDNFVSQLPDASYLQTSAWSMVNDNDPHQQSFVRVVIREGGGIVAGFQLTVRRYFKMGNIGFIFQGPCLRYPEPKYYDLVAASMKKLLKSENLLYLAICLNYAYSGLAEHLESRKFFKAYPGMPPIINTKATVLLDLTLSENDLFEQLDAGRRRNVRKGEKFKFDTRLGTRNDISTFYSLMLHTCNQRGVDPLIAYVDYFYSVWDLFHAKGWLLCTWPKLRTDVFVPLFATIWGTPIALNIGVGPESSRKRELLNRLSGRISCWRKIWALRSMTACR